MIADNADVQILKRKGDSMTQEVLDSRKISQVAQSNARQNRNCFNFGHFSKHALHDRGGGQLIMT